MHTSFKIQDPDPDFSGTFLRIFHKSRIYPYRTTAGKRFINKLLTMITIPRGKYTLQLKPVLQRYKSRKQKLSHFIFCFFFNWLLTKSKPPFFQGIKRQRVFTDPSMRQENSADLRKPDKDWFSSDSPGYLREQGRNHARNKEGFPPEALKSFPVKYET